MSPPEFRVVAHGSPEYWATVALRRRVLREPLGLDFSPEELQREEDQTHLAAFDGGEAVGCLVLAWADAGIAKMRQVAVSPEWQGRGLGRLLVEQSEGLAAERGFGEIVLHARETAVEFYRRLGYDLEGEPFEEVGLPHRRMRKYVSRL